jgi:hypothetical protein
MAGLFKGRHMNKNEKLQLTAMLSTCKHAVCLENMHSPLTRIHTHILA